MGVISKLFQAIARLFKSLFGGLKKVLSAIFKHIGPLAAIFAIACFCIPGLLPAVLSFLGAPSFLVDAGLKAAAAISSWSFGMQVAAGVGAVALVSPGTVGKLVSNLGDAANHVVDEVGNVAGNVAHDVGSVIGNAGSGLADGLGSTIKSVFTNPWILGAAAAGGLYLLMRKSEDPAPAPPTTAERAVERAEEREVQSASTDAPPNPSPVLRVEDSAVKPVSVVQSVFPPDNGALVPEYDYGY